VFERRCAPPGDAIHLATAESVDAAKLHTYNLSDFGRWVPVLGMTVENPASANPQMI
jgi:predicted nucleic acid-binding protein